MLKKVVINLASPRVKCVVNSCNHWVPGDLCTAENIDILNQQDTDAQIPGDTECKTFSERGIRSMIASMDNVNWVGMVEEPFKEGRQITPSVTCTVDSCVYWDEGKRCGADAIEVTGRDAGECEETNCETFENREG